MFTNVRVKNFRCFDEFQFDLSTKKSEPKHLIIIYGENGAGKSNVAAIFCALMELLRTMDVNEWYNSLLEQIASSKDVDLRQALQRTIRDVPAIVRDFKMADCGDNIELEFKFSLDGKHGIYYIELNQDSVVHERLEFVLEKRRAMYFDMKENDYKIRNTLFVNPAFYDDIMDQAQKYWGKHPLLSIVFYEMRSKAKNYVLESISENFRLVLDFFASVGGAVKRGERSQLFSRSVVPDYLGLDRGTISKDRADGELEKARLLVKEFLSTINSDIQDVYYDLRPVHGEDSFVEYRLHLKKMISGKVRDINFKQESTGMQQMLGLLNNLLVVTKSGVEVLDEMDSGIHDLAAQKILRELYPTIQGQLIITTHNTLFMDCDFAKEAIYILKEDENAHRTMDCLMDSSVDRIYQKTNIKRKYLDGDYNGVPSVGALDFEKMGRLF